MLAKFEPNRIVRNVQNLSFWGKTSSFKNIFDKALTPFCKKFLWLKQLFDGKLLIFRQLSFCVSISLFNTIVRCSKHYGNPTRVTRLKVAPNMADPNQYETLSQ